MPNKMIIATPTGLAIADATGLNPSLILTEDSVAVPGGLGTASAADTGVAEGNVPLLGAGGKLATSLLPPLALTETLSVANAAARLLLTSEQAQGKIVVEADGGKSYGLITGGNPATSGDWIQVGDRDVQIGDVGGLQAALDAKETPAGAQSKADIAANAAVEDLLSADNSWEGVQSYGNTLTTNGLFLAGPLASFSYLGITAAAHRTALGVTPANIGAETPAGAAAQIAGEIQSLHLPPRRAYPDAGLFLPMRLMLAANRSTGIKNVGDSLGNGSDEFMALFANHIAAAYPDHRVIHNILTTNADPALGTWAETVVQAASGERFLNFPNQRVSQRCNTSNTLSATGTGTLTVTVTAAGMTNSPKAVAVSVVSGDTNFQLSEKMRLALLADADVSAHCDVAASLDRVILTKKVLAAHDSTFNVATTSTGLGITNDTTSDIGVYGAFFPIGECPVPTGDFEIEAKIRVTNATVVEGPVWAWWGGATPELARSFRFDISAGSKLALSYYDSTGTLRSGLSVDLTASLPANGTDWWVKASVDVDNGAGGTTTTFFKSTDGRTWTLLTTLTITGTGVFQQSLSTGSIGSVGANPLYGVRVYKVRVRNGINGPITNNTAIDNCSLGATNNFLEFGGSPEFHIENYAHSGITTGSLVGHITGIRQYETATASGTITGDGNATVTVTGVGITGSPLAVSVAVLNGDTAAVWGNKVKVALLATPAITALYDVVGYNASIALRSKISRANDTTLNIALANGTCTGITAAPTSATTTAGLAPWPDLWMQNNGDANLIFSAGMNDIGAIGTVNGKEWTDGVASIFAKLKVIAPQATPIILGSNPSIVVPAANATAYSTWSREQHPMRMARGAALAKANDWGYLDVWSAFMDDGRALDTLIPDGVHGSATASSEIFAPVITGAYDSE